VGMGVGVGVGGHLVCQETMSILYVYLTRAIRYLFYADKNALSSNPPASCLPSHQRDAILAVYFKR